MKVKFIELRKQKLILEEDVKLHKANIYLGVESIYLKGICYKIIDSTLDFDEHQLIILLQQL
jgi:hypothetical protein